MNVMYLFFFLAATMSDPNDAATAVQNAPPATMNWQKSPVIDVHSAWLKNHYKITAGQAESAYLQTAAFLTTARGA